MLVCIDCQQPKPDVRPRTTPDRTDYRTFDRCDGCFDKRIKRMQAAGRRYAC